MLLLVGWSWTLCSSVQRFWSCFTFPILSESLPLEINLVVSPQLQCKILGIYSANTALLKRGCFLCEIHFGDEYITEELYPYYMCKHFIRKWLGEILFANSSGSHRAPSPLLPFTDVLRYSYSTLLYTLTFALLAKGLIFTQTVWNYIHVKGNLLQTQRSLITFTGKTLWM